MSRARRGLLGLLTLVVALLLPLASQAGTQLLCSREREASVAEQARALRFSAVLRELMEAGGQDLALVARDGLDLRRWGQRYSHAGLALRDNPAGPWAVRQLYFDCDSGRPRLFDQGLAAFVRGSQRPEQGFVAVLLLPPEASETLRALALDNGRALGLVNPAYSANAYVFGLRFQNCNQWLAELLAAAWGEAQDRAQAQAWLREQGYGGTVLQLPGRPWLWLAAFSPWLHLAEHPEEDLAAARLRISLPQGLMDWLQQRFPAARRVDVCEAPEGLIQREGGFDPQAACVLQPGDRLRATGD
ncbi:DUF2145 domain-containing protein [Roseateles sp. DB2]|uniref:DUF2145 domain-containing protein n=1 Tax=Roseateles sp. DB2 TaxID=3453717 RepID=UPI003EE8A9BC